MLVTPRPWSNTTAFPYFRNDRTSTTRPAAGARMAVPTGAAMSTPLCRPTGRPFRSLSTPNSLEIRPRTGSFQSPFHRGRGERVRSATRIVASSASTPLNR
jgi:hypothetical protein